MMSLKLKALYYRLNDSCYLWLVADRSKCTSSTTYQTHLKAVRGVLPVCCCNDIINLHFYRFSPLQLIPPLW